jgi:quinol monooxygenase YgiN
VIQLLIRLTAVPARRRELGEALVSTKHQIVSLRGCSGVQALADLEEPDVLWYCEEWHDRREFHDYLRSEQFARLLAIVETAACRPFIEFREVAETRGLDLVAELKGLPPYEG